MAVAKVTMLEWLETSSFNENQKWQVQIGGRISTCDARIMTNFCAARGP
jgi:hypothetical protein